VSLWTPSEYKCFLTHNHIPQTIWKQCQTVPHNLSCGHLNMFSFLRFFNILKHILVTNTTLLNMRVNSWNYENRNYKCYSLHFGNLSLLVSFSTNWLQVGSNLGPTFYSQVAYNGIKNIIFSSILVSYKCLFRLNEHFLMLLGILKEFIPSKSILNFLL
jgi:hypothetical protein